MTSWVSASPEGSRTFSSKSREWMAWEGQWRGLERSGGWRGPRALRHGRTPPPSQGCSAEGTGLWGGAALSCCCDTGPGRTSDSGRHRAGSVQGWARQPRRAGAQGRAQGRSPHGAAVAEEELARGTDAGPPITPVSETEQRRAVKKPVWSQKASGEPEDPCPHASR